MSPVDSVPQLSTLQLQVIDGPVRARLQRVRRLLQQHEWEAAVDSMRTLGDEFGGQLVSLGPPDARFQRFVPLTDLLHEILCALPEDQAGALAVYRQRVDVLARTWYERGLQRHDEQHLTRLVRELFPSSWGDDAALLLGDLALERGEPDLARSYWRRLHVSLATQAAADLRKRASSAASTTTADGEQIPEALAGLPVYPDSEIPLPDLRARMMLASLMAGSWTRAASEYQEFCAAHPQAEGDLGGRRVSYVEALAELLQQARQWPVPQVSSDWLTFAGNPTRNRVAAPIADVSVEPAWKIRLDPSGTYHGAAVRRWGVPEVRVAESDRQLCSCHPLVIGSLVVVASQNRLRCFELATGRPVDWANNDAGQIYPSRDLDPAELEPATWRGLHVPRFTLTAEGLHVYCLLPAAAVEHLDISADNPSGNRLIGIDLQSQGKLLFPPVAPPDRHWYFAGTPLVEGVDVYVCLWEDAAVPAVHVACLRGGKWRWMRRIGHGHPLATAADRGQTHHLLTRVGDTLYISTDLGAVASVSKRDGQIQWVTRYPRAALTVADLRGRPWHLWRDLTPCVWHDGRLLIAPCDYDGVFALEASSGELLWESDLPPGTLDATQLIGLANGRLLASGRRLWWFDADTGRLSGQIPENPFPREPSSLMTGFGRGVLAGSQLLWPVRDRVDQILLFDTSRGRTVRQPIPLTGVGVSAGNLIVAQQHLLVAGPEELVAFRLVDAVKERSMDATSDKADPVALNVTWPVTIDCGSTRDDRRVASGPGKGR